MAASIRDRAAIAASTANAYIRILRPRLTAGPFQRRGASAAHGRQEPRCRDTLMAASMALASAFPSKGLDNCVRPWTVPRATSA